MCVCVGGGGGREGIIFYFIFLQPLYGGRVQFNKPLHILPGYTYCAVYHVARIIRKQSKHKATLTSVLRTSFLLISLPLRLLLHIR